MPFIEEINILYCTLYKLHQNVNSTIIIKEENVMKLETVIIFFLKTDYM